MKCQPLMHCAGRVLGSIYPLTRDAYRNESLARRSSYAYLVDVVELVFENLGEMVERLTGKSPPAAYYPRFRTAGEAGLINSDLSSALVTLQTLRHKVVHDGAIANRQLILYPELGKLGAVALAIYLLSNAFVGLERGGVPDARDSVVRVDGAFLRTWMLTRGLDTLACERIAHDEAVGVYLIDLRKLHRLLKGISRPALDGRNP